MTIKSNSPLETIFSYNSIKFQYLRNKIIEIYNFIKDLINLNWKKSYLWFFIFFSTLLINPLLNRMINYQNKTGAIYPNSYENNFSELNILSEKFKNSKLSSTVSRNNTNSNEDYQNSNWDLSNMSYFNPANPFNPISYGKSSIQAIRLRKHFTCQTQLLVQPNEPTYVGAFAMSTDIRKIRTSPLKAIFNFLWDRDEFLKMKSAILVFVTCKILKP